MAEKPDTNAPFYPLGIPMKVEGNEFRGTAIAVAFQGRFTVYLVARSAQAGPPIWVSDSEITNATVG